MEDIRPVKFKKPFKRFWRRKYAPILVFMVLVLGLLAFTSSTSPSVFNFLNPFGGLSLDRGRVNIVLLGIAGKGHDGPNLTDTLMVASIDPDKKSVDLISLPRDLWIDKYQVKVNALYQLGINRDRGIEFVRAEVGEILGIAIPYGARVDFNGFIKAVDLVEGLSVGVEKSFDDYFYPVPGKETETCDLLEKELDIPEDQAKTLGILPGKIKALVEKDGKIATVAAQPENEFEFTDKDIFRLFPCRFEHLRFEAGLSQMDGMTALKYVRSRHGTNNEGSDFARAKRQQLVIDAFRDKVFSLSTLTDPAKLSGLVSAFGSSVEMDIPTKDYATFIKLLKGVKTIRSFVIDDGSKTSILVHPGANGYGGAFVLIPPGNDFSVVHRYVDKIFSYHPEATPSSEKHIP